MGEEGGGGRERERGRGWRCERGGEGGDLNSIS